VFSGNHSLRAALFLMKVGQMGKELGCVNPSPQETHFGDYEHSSTLWNSLEQLGHLLIPMQVGILYMTILLAPDASYWDSQVLVNIHQLVFYMDAACE
jgi:hypothetical protein